MTLLQKLTLRLSEIRSKLNELAGLEQLTAEQSSEIETLSKEYQEKETQFRAATIAEGEKATGKEFQENSEGAEIRALKEKVSLRDYFQAAGSGAALVGPAAELNDALELRGGGNTKVPWTVLMTPELEKRASDTSDLDGGTAQRPVLRRLFGRSIMESLGIRIDSVPVGMSEFPLLTAGISPDQKAESADSPTADPTFASAILKPKRLTGQYAYTVEQVAQVSDIEEALRRDLADAVLAKMSDQTINGDGTTPNVRGLAAAITQAAVPMDVFTISDYAGLAASGVDGIHAYMQSEVSVLLGVASYRHAAKLFNTNNNDLTGLEALISRSAQTIATAFISAPPDSGAREDTQDFYLHAGTEEMRGDSVAAVWPALELVRDVYSRAKQGEVILTWIALWDLYAALRTGAYIRGAVKVG